MLTDYKLFAGFTEDQANRLMTVLDARERKYGAGETILREGETNYYIRLLLIGSAKCVKYAVSGGSEVYINLQAGSIFGGVIAVSGGEPSEVSVIAVTQCRCLLIDYRSVISSEIGEAELRMKLVAAITRSLSEKYFALRDRLDCITQPTLRQKILCYLRFECGKSGVAYTQYDREGMAAYLCCDRSALSRELSRMQKEGIIEYYKNSFKLV